MKRITIGLFMLIISASSYAGDAENISTCIKKAKELSGIVLDEFEVNYEGNWLFMSVAKWANVYCEVKIGEVYRLSIGGDWLIYDGFYGKGSYDLNKALQEQTDVAINKLSSRITLLRHRMNKVTEELKKPGAIHNELSSYIEEGINKSTNCIRWVDGTN